MLMNGSMCLIGLKVIRPIIKAVRSPSLLATQPWATSWVVIAKISGITIAAIVVAVGQFIFFVNVIYSLAKGKKADPNPWRATTLEWQTPDTPAKHGNWGEKLPEVHRWAYDYSVPGDEEDYIPQNHPIREGEASVGT